jgi:hypothetical protein
MPWLGDTPVLAAKLISFTNETISITPINIPNTTSIWRHPLFEISPLSPVWALVRFWLIPRRDKLRYVSDHCKFSLTVFFNMFNTTAALFQSHVSFTKWLSPGTKISWLILRRTKLDDLFGG